MSAIVVTVGDKTYSVPWWWLLAAWLVVCTGMLVWEGVQKVREMNRPKKPWDGNIEQYRLTLGTPRTLRSPNTRQGYDETAGASTRPQNKGPHWRPWLTVAAEVATIIGLLFALLH